MLVPRCWSNPSPTSYFGFKNGGTLSRTSYVSDWSNMKCRSDLRDWHMPDEPLRTIPRRISRMHLKFIPIENNLRGIVVKAWCSFIDLWVGNSARRNRWRFCLSYAIAKRKNLKEPQHPQTVMTQTSSHLFDSGKNLSSLAYCKNNPWRKCLFLNTRC
jgi:hypothetical protein